MEVKKMLTISFPPSPSLSLSLLPLYPLLPSPEWQIALEFLFRKRAKFCYPVGGWGGVGLKIVLRLNLPSASPLGLCVYLGSRRIEYWHPEAVPWPYQVRCQGPGERWSSGDTLFSQGVQSRETFVVWLAAFYIRQLILLMLEQRCLGHGSTEEGAINSWTTCSDYIQNQKKRTPVC